MNLPTAKKYAQDFLRLLAPHCERLEIAGSIRRDRPVCNDIDLVCIPKITIARDMFGEETGRTNHAHRFLQQYVDEYGCAPGPGHEGCRFISGGEREGKQVIVQFRKCQLDLWFADADTFASRFLMRTGSKEHNIFLAARAIDLGLRWATYEGIKTASGTLLPATTEADLYKHLGLPFIEPANREPIWMANNLSLSSGERAGERAPPLRDNTEQATP